MTINKYILEEMPFIIGANSTPHNPHGLPNKLPFYYFLEPHSNVIKQCFSTEIEKHLQTAYENGTHPGTPMDIEGEGSGYLFDFLNFIKKMLPNLNKKNILEIGCGQGFLLSVLQDNKANVIGIEPGKNHKSHWKKNKVNVINDFFPSPEMTNKFDLIIAYAVLEHINDAEEFVKSIANQLLDNGKIILAVPNCEEQIKNCDPSLFVHEHYSYFSKESLANFLAILGFKINSVEYAGYGGSIYICAEKSNAMQSTKCKNTDFDIEHFASEINKFKGYLKTQINILKSQEKTLGIYCPGRALSSIPTDSKYRFFDDDTNIHGQYYPPFTCQIENRQDLINNPVDVLWVFSYSFGDKIKDKLIKNNELSKTQILTLSELNEN